MNKSQLSVIWQRMGTCLRPNIVVATISINVLSIALPIVILQLYDRIIPFQAFETLAVLASALAVVVLMDSGLRLCRTMIMNRLGAEFEHCTTMNLLDVILHSDLAEFESVRYTEYLEKIEAVQSIRDIQFGQNIISLLDLPFVFVFLVMIWFFTGSLVLVPLTLFVLFTIFSVYISKKLYLGLLENDTVTEQRHNFLLEVLQGIQTLKPLAMESQMLRRYERLQSRSTKVVYELAYIGNITQAITSTLSQFTIVLFVAIGAIYAISGNLSIGSLAAGSMLAGRILQPASRAINFWMQWQTAKVSEEKLINLLNLTQEPVQHNPDKIVIEGGIELRDVSFVYKKGGQPIIDHLSITIPEKKFITITGDNGSGKSTLAKLLIGIEPPTEGKILYDGKPAETIDRDCLRRQIAFVPQRGSLFSGSILDNLTVFRNSRVAEALEYTQELGLEDAIMRMVDGLATHVDSTLIDNIPEGLRQRITIVRALLGNEKIIIFDDANTGYDIKNLNKLIDFFKKLKGQHTIIIMTHQDELIDISDRCYQLEDGTLKPLIRKNRGNANDKTNVSIVKKSGMAIKGGRVHG